MKTSCYLVVLSLFCCNALLAQQQWQHTDGPVGGMSGPLFYNNQYVFSSGNTLFRSADGFNWENLGQGNFWPMRLVGDTLYALQRLSINPYTVRFAVSNDNGETWTTRNLPPTKNGSFFSFAVCSQGVFVPDHDKNHLWRSTDGGLNWDSFPQPSNYCGEVWAYDDHLFVYSELHRCIYKLQPNGVDWLQTSPVFSTNEYVRAFFVSDSLIMISTYDNGAYRLWRSKNGGGSWGKKGLYLRSENFVERGNRIYLAAGDTRLTYTENQGDVWVEVPLPQSYYVDDVATINGQIVCGSYNKGHLRLVDSTQTLVPSDGGLTYAPVSFLTIDSNTLWAACYNGVFAYDLTDGIWVDKAPLPLPANTDIYESIKISPTGKLLAYENDKPFFYLSLDEGGSWDTVYPFLNDMYGAFKIDQAFWLGDTLAVQSFFSPTTHKRSVDYGQTWTRLETQIRDIVFFKGKQYGLSLYSNDLLSSTNQGQSWELEATLPINGYKLYTSQDRLFVFGVLSDAASSTTALYTSVDGKTWQYANDGLPNKIFSKVHWGYFPTSLAGNVWSRNGAYYLSINELGFFISLDSCQSWLPISQIAGIIPYGDTTLFRGGLGVQKSGYANYYGSISSGLVYADINNNGQQDPNETVLPNVRVNMKKQQAWFPYWFVYTQNDGSYAIGNTPDGVDTLSVTVRSKYVAQINPPSYAIDSSSNARDFGVYFTPNINDVSIRAAHAGRPRPGYPLTVQLNCRNEGTTRASTAVAVKLDAAFQYMEATPVPTAVYGTDSLVWQLDTINLFAAQPIHIKGTVNVNKPIGTPFTTTAYAFNSVPDFTPDDNVFVRTDTVVGAYDPNEKRVEPENGISPEDIAAGKPLLYTVHFQNTGNYPADRVRITDQLDTSLDAQTLQLVHASHQVTSFTLRPGNLLEIIFDNIALPDSNSNEPDSHGFVTFSIERKKQYNLYYKTANRAAIYFDFNEPIFTNTVKTPVIQQSVGTYDPQAGAGKKLELLISPNPNNGHFSIDTHGALSGPGELTIWDELGRLVFRQTVPELATNARYQVSGLSNSTYMVKLTGKNGQMTGKMTIYNK